MQRQENEINYDWADGSPAPVVNTEQFSARWTRTINVAAGTYRFTATTDDGMRVWVDNSLIIDSWWDSQVHALTKDVYLNAGDHQLKVEYYEAGGKAVARMTWAAVSGPGPVPISNWRGEYFNNMTLAGTPVLVRDDANIDFDWGGGAPAWGVVASDQFSVRWTRSPSLEGGTYRFQVTADDGARLWVNGALLVDEWHEAGLTTYTRDVELPAGAIPVKFEYFENMGGAVAKLSWTRLNSGGQWQGQYFANRTLSGSPALTRGDAAVNFNWGTGAPAPGLPVDNFSVRWTRTMPFTAGQYRFTATSDDGVRIWVNNQIIINDWSDHAQRTTTNDVTLPAGTLPIVVEYYDNGGGAMVQVGWTFLGSTPPPPPPPTTAPTGTVVSALLNVRSGPGLQYVILNQLQRGQTVALTGYRSANLGWVQIPWAGSTAWISAAPAYLQTSVPVSTLTVWNAAPPAPTVSGTAVVINVYFLNVRTGPGTSFGIITSVPSGIVVTLQGRNTATTWIKARLADGTVGWVSAYYLRSSTNFSTLPIAN